MSFFTSLTFYRPRVPPAVTADDLARFISQILEAGVLTDDGFQSLQVKFGDSIDQDEHDASYEEEIRPGMFVSRNIEWDLDFSDPSGIQHIIERLAGDNRRIYRAYTSLGGLIDAVLKPITRTNSPENEIDFCPDSLSVEIGPIKIFDLDSDRAFVGWTGVSLSGYGYLFPWTFQDVVHRLEATPETQCLMNVCRSIWPVSPETPEPRIVELRPQLGELWPYNSFDKPWDWYWGVQESG